MPNEKVIRAPEGYGFVRGRGTMLMRKRSTPEQVVLIFRDEFRRLGWAPKTVKVQQATNDPVTDGPRFYLHLGVLRGLDPQAALNELRALPDKCGVRRVMAALAKVGNEG